MRGKRGTGEQRGKRVRQNNELQNGNVTNARKPNNKPVTVGPKRVAKRSGERQAQACNQNRVKRNETV